MRIEKEEEDEMKSLHRLKKNEDFSLVFKKGKSFADVKLVLYYRRKNPTEPYRVGFSVGKKLGNAVLRNRIKRLLREVVRLNADHIPDGVDLVLIARPRIIDQHYTEIEKSFIKLMKKSSLWQ